MADPPALSLRAAAGNIHRDRSWWLKVMLYGGCALSVVGLPIAVGFVLESFDNSRKGYPTPLPPWSDWTLRALAGILAMLIDFIFFVLPLLFGGLLLLCVSLALLIGGASNPVVLGTTIGLLSSCAGGFVLLMFLCGAAPAGRLRFVRDGRIEEALTFDVLRWVVGQPARGFFLRARLLSLPAYLPALLLGIAGFNLARVQFPGQLPAMLLVVWLALSALVYAHIVVAQLYVAAEREIERRAMVS